MRFADTLAFSRAAPHFSVAARLPPPVAVAAAVLGYWASRVTIRPLTRVSQAAQSVAAGQLDTRLDYNRVRHDPDLDVNAIDELLRFVSPVQFSRRITLTDIIRGAVPTCISSSFFIFSIHNSHPWRCLILLIQNPL